MANQSLFDFEEEIIPPKAEIITETVTIIPQNVIPKIKTVTVLNKTYEVSIE